MWSWHYVVTFPRKRGRSAFALALAREVGFRVAVDFLGRFGLGPVVPRVIEAASEMGGALAAFPSEVRVAREASTLDRVPRAPLAIGAQHYGSNLQPNRAFLSVLAAVLRAPRASPSSQCRSMFATDSTAPPLGNRGSRRWHRRRRLQFGQAPISPHDASPTHRHVIAAIPHNVTTRTATTAVRRERALEASGDTGIGVSDGRQNLLGWVKPLPPEQTPPQVGVEGLLVGTTPRTRCDNPHIARATRLDSHPPAVQVGGVPDLYRAIQTQLQKVDYWDGHPCFVPLFFFRVTWAAVFLLWHAAQSD